MDHKKNIDNINSESESKEELLENNEDTSVCYEESSYYYDEHEEEIGKKDNKQDYNLVPVRKKKKRRKKHFFLDVFVVIGLTVSIIIFLSSSYFDIKYYDIVGNDRFSNEKIIEILDIKKGTNLVWLSKSEYIEKLKKEPFIKDVKLQKKIPKKLGVVIEERVPVATIKYGNKYVLLDEEGIVLSLRTKRPKVTEIGNTKICKMKLNQKLGVEKENDFNKALEFIKSAKKQDLFFMKVKIDDKNVDINVYDYLMIEGKIDLVLKNINQGYITEVLVDLREKKIKRGTVIVEDKKSCYYTPIFK